MYSDKVKTQPPQSAGSSSQPASAPATPAGTAGALVKEFLHEKREEKAGLAAMEHKRKTSHVKKQVILGVVCAAAWLVPLPQPTPPVVPSEAPLNSAKVQVLFAASKLHSYTMRHGTLPQSLAEAGVDDSLEYLRVSDTQFALRSPFPGVQYDSSNPTLTAVLGSDTMRVEGPQ